MVQELTYSIAMVYPEDSAASSHCEIKKLEEFQVGLQNI